MLIVVVIVIAVVVIVNVIVIVIVIVIATVNVSAISCHNTENFMFRKNCYLRIRSTKKFIVCCNIKHHII